MISIICKSEMQQAKALKIKTVLGKGVEVFKPQTNTEVKGVVYNVPVEVSEQEILTIFKRRKYCSCKTHG